MPTVDQLAPATAASDGDILLVSQSGTSRKVTRSQIIAGLQAQIVVPGGALLGRASNGNGTIEPIQIGPGLTLSAGSLAVNSSMFATSALPAGVVPGPADRVRVNQNGTEMAVSYSQFMMGISSLPALDISTTLITPAGSIAPQRVAVWAGSVLTTAGGAFSGAVTLAADPTSNLQPATKQYVDTKSAALLAIAGGTVTGPLTVAASTTISAGLSVATSIACGGPVTVSGPLSASSAAVTGAVTVGSSLSIAGSVNLGGNVIASGSANVAGNSSITGTLAVQGGLTVTGGSVLLPSYAVASLPTASAGALAYAGNGRKPGEGAGAGTGVLVWGTSGHQWMSILSGTTVQA